MRSDSVVEKKEKEEEKEDEEDTAVVNMTMRK